MLTPNCAGEGKLLSFLLETFYWAAEVQEVVHDGRDSYLRLVYRVLDYECSDLSSALSLLQVRYGSLLVATKEVTEIINQVNATSPLMPKARP